MPFRLNRPFSLGKYAKIRLNKKSIGLQVGGKYLKGTINTKGQATGSVGGAGTGMYIQKTTNLSKPLNVMQLQIGKNAQEIVMKQYSLHAT